jgi:hypothetical protein
MQGGIKVLKGLEDRLMERKDGESRVSVACSVGKLLALHQSMWVGPLLVFWDTADQQVSFHLPSEAGAYRLLVTLQVLQWTLDPLLSNVALLSSCMPIVSSCWSCCISSVQADSGQYESSRKYVLSTYCLSSSRDSVVSKFRACVFSCNSHSGGSRDTTNIQINKTITNYNWLEGNKQGPVIEKRVFWEDKSN